MKKNRVADKDDDNTDAASTGLLSFFGSRAM